MQLIDIGVNLTNNRLVHDIEQVLEQAKDADVVKMLVTGTSLSSSEQAIALCLQYPSTLYATCGIHPHDAKEWHSDTFDNLKKMLSDDCVKAVGETGLDFNRNFSPRDQQVDVFQQQLELAASINKPVFLHQRDAFKTFYALIKEYRDRLTGAVAHCFTDDKQALTQLLDLDCHIGITGWICDERRGLELQSIVKYIPEDRLMLETDAPYLLPRNLPAKPKNNINYPKYLPHILETVAHHQNKAIDQLAEEAWHTTVKFFRL